MEIVESVQGDVTIVEPVGRIDSGSSTEFGDRLVMLIKEGAQKVVVDFSQIIYISSAGFRALLIAAQNATEANGNFALCGLSAEVRRLFEMGAFTDLFPIYGSRKEGVDGVS